MPKVLLYSTWIFLFYDTDLYENRAHVHVGKKNTKYLTKIWLEPEIKIAKEGELNYFEEKEILKITQLYKEDLIKQWKRFKKGQKVQIIKIQK